MIENVCTGNPCIVIIDLLGKPVFSKIDKFSEKFPKGGGLSFPI